MLSPSDIRFGVALAVMDQLTHAQDPSEVSFRKGEVFDIIDDSGKWWNIRKAGGEVRSRPATALADATSPVLHRATI